MGRPCRCCEDPVVSSSSSSSSVASSSVSSVVSSSVSSSSTSVVCECGETCSWTWNGSAWTKTEDNCVWDPEDCGDPVPCECYKPGIEEPDTGVTYITPCIAESDCCGGACSWLWTDDDGLEPYHWWVLDDDSCEGTEIANCVSTANCECVPPTAAGTVDLQELSGPCRPADCGTCVYGTVLAADGVTWLWKDAPNSTSCTGDCTCDSKYSPNFGEATDGKTATAWCHDMTW